MAFLLILFFFLGVTVHRAGTTILFHLAGLLVTSCYFSFAVAAFYYRPYFARRVLDARVIVKESQVGRAFS